MCQLSEREHEILERLMLAEPRKVANDLGITASTIYVVRGRVRGKIEAARDFLKECKKYKRAIGVSTRLPGR